LPHQRDHANHLAAAVLCAEVNAAGALVIWEANFVRALMRPQDGLAKAEDFVSPAPDN
jgi:hypothetical protein